MMKPFRLLAAALGCVAAVALASPCAQAQEKHDSNTLHKIGKAIQYPVKKAGENISITAHRATGRKSVVHRRNGSRTYRSVITPNGRIYRKHLVSAAYTPRMGRSRTMRHSRMMRHGTYRTHHRMMRHHRHHRMHRRYHRAHKM